MSAAPLALSAEAWAQPREENYAKLCEEPTGRRRISVADRLCNYTDSHRSRSALSLYAKTTYPQLLDAAQAARVS